MLKEYRLTSKIRAFFHNQKTEKANCWREKARNGLKEMQIEYETEIDRNRLKNKVQIILCFSGEQSKRNQMKLNTVRGEGKISYKEIRRLSKWD